MNMSSVNVGSLSLVPVVLEHCSSEAICTDLDGPLSHSAFATHRRVISSYSASINQGAQSETSSGPACVVE